MTTNALRITAGGEVLPVALDDLADFQRIVGGYVETVTLPDIDTVIWLNEDGKLLGLPANRVATLLAKDAGLMPGDVIVGDVVVTGGADDNGDETDLPPAGWLAVGEAAAAVKAAR